MRRSSPSRRALAFAALAVVGGAPRPGRAAPPIAWEAPAGCPDAAALQTEVDRLVGRDADAASAISSVHARAAPQGQGWSLVVTIVQDGRTHVRTLTTDTCEAAVRAAGFVIAIAVDPAVGGLEVPPPPPPAGEPVPAAPAAPEPAPAAPEPAPPAEAEEEPPSVPDPPPRPAPRRLAPRGLLQVGPAVQAGMLPVGVGLTAAAGLVWRRLRISLGYTRWFRTALRSDSDPTLGGRASVHAATLRVGPVLRAGPLELPLHLGVELGALQAVGVGGDVNFTRAGLWGAALAGVGLAWAPRALAGHGALILLAEAAVAVHRPRFVFNQDLEIARIGPAAFRGLLLLEARFP